MRNGRKGREEEVVEKRRDREGVKGREGGREGGRSRRYIE